MIYLKNNRIAKKHPECEIILIIDPNSIFENVRFQDPNAEIGQRVHLSDTDVRKLMKMYNC